MARSPSSSVWVIGSANIDVSVTTAVLPRPGETVIGGHSLIALGGKGANQAVACAACGAETHFVGRIGDDAFGRMVTHGLRGRGVHIEELRPVDGEATGIATIAVEDSGRNCIIVVPGANELLRPADMDRLAPVPGSVKAVVLQCEIPMDTMYRAVELWAAHAIVILNPAPFRGLDLARVAPQVAYLVPNEREAAALWGRDVETIEEAGECGRWLVAQGIQCVIVTLGAQGCMVVDAQSTRHHRGHVVNAIDTTGAGDAFVGCLAASLAGGWSRDESVERALFYSALSTTRRGAQESYPTADEFAVASRLLHQ